MTPEYKALSPSLLSATHFRCTASNLVYCISCHRCQHGQLLYIGETGRSLGSRFGEHLRMRSVHKNKPGFPVAQHFNLPDYIINDMHLRGVQLCTRSNITRKQRVLWSPDGSWDKRPGDLTGAIVLRFRNSTDKSCLQIPLRERSRVFA